MRRALIGAVVCIGSVVGGGAGAAFAGEITGGGPGGVPKVTPIGAVHGPIPESICAYSGLEEYPTAIPGVTQTPHLVGGYYPDPGSARACSYENYGHLK